MVLFLWQHLKEEFDKPLNPLLIAAMATPLLCYSRDIWTEPWIAAIWLALLSTRKISFRIVLGFIGTLIKYPFFVVPFALGIVHCIRGRKKSGLALIGSSTLAITTSIVVVQWIFQDVTEHQSLFHSGIHSGFQFSLEGLFGLLLSPENGLLIFFPILIDLLRSIIETK